MHTFNSIALRVSGNNRTKRIISVVVILLAVLSFSTNAYAEDDGPDVDGAVDLIDFNSVDDYLDDTGISDNMSTNQIIKRIIDSNYDIEVIMDCLDITTWFDDIRKTFVNLLITLVFIMLCCALTNSVAEKSSKDMIDTIAVVFIILLSIGPIRDCANASILIYYEIERFSSVMIPLLCTILTIMGGVGSAGLTQAAILMVNSTLLRALDAIIMPLIMTVIVMGLIAPLSSRDWLNSLKDTLSSAIKWGLGLTVTIAATVFSLRGLSVAATDGIMLKTAEYAISDLVPVVGGSISKITGVIIGGIVMVKNAFGAVSIVVLLSRCLSPVVLIMMYIFLYKIASAIADLFQNKKISTLCSSISKGLTLYLVVCVSIIVILLVIIIASVGAANRIMAFA